MEVVKSLLERLQQEDDKLQVLLDGKAHLVKVNTSSLKDFIKAQDVMSIFDCLNTTNKEEIAAAVYILKMLLPVLDVGDKLEVLSDRLQKGLEHEDEEVRHLCLKELQSYCVTDVGNQLLLSSEDLLGRVIELISNKDMSIALQAASLISDFGSYSLSGCEVLMTGPLVSKLKSVMQTDDSVRYRVYSAVTALQAKSEQHLTLCVKSGIIQQLIDELNGTDILIRVNCIAALSEMAFTEHSLHYLKQSGVIDKLVQMITNTSSDPLSDLYMPEIVKFFGKMCHVDGPQNVLQHFPQFLPTLFALIEDRDPVKKKVAIETLGFIGQSVEGKHTLAKMGPRTLDAIKEISSIFRSVGDALRLYSINTMCQLLHVDLDQQTEDVLDLTLQWFQCISPEPVDTIISLCKQPFTDVKCAGMHLIQTLAGLEWGMAALVEFPTFTEYILDRSTDSEKEVKEARFQAVKALAESPHCQHVFGNSNWMKFRIYVKEGPLYKEALLTVDIEEA